MRLIAIFLIGLLFGTGIVVAGMANPAKVLNFFDVAGAWDPSLICVMGGALAVSFAGYRLVLSRPAPMFEARFALPTNQRIDARLLGGSALFGVGWGITGFCPGGALPAIGTLDPDVWIFVLSLVVGMVVARVLGTWLSGPATGTTAKA
jgi:hypothetical protein